MAVTVLRQDFEAGVVGDDVDLTNTDGAEQSPMSTVVTGGGSVKFTATGGVAVNGQSALCTAPSGAAALVTWNLAATTTFGINGILRIPDVTATGAVLAVRSPSGALLQAQIGTDNKMRFLYPGGTAYTTTALTLPGVYKIEMTADTGTTATDGRVKFVIRDGVSLALVGGMSAAAELTGVNAGAGAGAFVAQAGKVNTTTDAQNYVVDDLHMVLGAYGFPSDVGTLPPTASPGIPQTVEPWRLITLDGSSSSDPNGATLTYSWTQPAGITLSATNVASPTFTAPPALTTKVYNFTLTVGNGSTTTSADVAVTVLYATDQIVNSAGVLVPCRKMIAIGPPDDELMQMLNPIDAQDVAGDVVLKVQAPSDATAVVFELGKSDFPDFAATKVSGTNRWESNVAWKTGKSLADQTTNLISDYPTWIRAKITRPSGTVYTSYVTCFPNNFNLAQYGTTPMWDDSYAFSTTLKSGIATYYAGYQNAYGKVDNPPDGLHVSAWPTAVVVDNAQAPEGKFAKVTYSDTNTANQPNGATGTRRWQMQSPEYPEGSKFYVGVGWMTPNETSGVDGMPTPTTSHISIHQIIGTGIDPNSGNDTSFSLGLRLQQHAHNRTTLGSDGFSDVESSYWFVGPDDRGHGEPALLSKIPFLRGQVQRQIWEVAISADPRKGGLRMWRSVGSGAWAPCEFFGIPGQFFVPCALIEPGGTGQDFHQHVYRSAGKWPYVTFYHSRMVITKTFADAASMLSPTA